MLIDLQILKGLNAKALTIVGSDLVFSALNLTIKGIPGFDLQLLYRGLDSPYAIEAPQPSFRISTEDFKILLLANTNTAVDLEFSFSDPSFSYGFIIQEAVPDLYGWVYLNCILTTKDY